MARRRRRRTSSWVKTQCDTKIFYDSSLSKLLSKKSSGIITNNGITLNLDKLSPSIENTDHVIGNHNQWHLALNQNIPTLSKNGESLDLDWGGDWDEWETGYCTNNTGISFNFIHNDTKGSSVRSDRTSGTFNIPYFFVHKKQFNKGGGNADRAIYTIANNRDIFINNADILNDGNDTYVLLNIMIRYAGFKGFGYKGHAENSGAVKMSMYMDNSTPPNLHPGDKLYCNILFKYNKNNNTLVHKMLRCHSTGTVHTHRLALEGSKITVVDIDSITNMNGYRALCYNKSDLNANGSSDIEFLKDKKKYLLSYPTVSSHLYIVPLTLIFKYSNIDVVLSNMISVLAATIYLLVSAAVIITSI